MGISRLWAVQRNELSEAWPHVEKLVIDALDHGTSRVGVKDVYDGIGTGRYQLWIAWGPAAEGIAVTEILDTEKERIASVFICVGKNLKEWLRHLSSIENWAKAEGCSVIEAWARPGWERVLKDYKKTHVQLEKNL